MTKIVTRIAVYGLLALVLLLTYQLALSWIQGIARNPWQSISRRPATRAILKPDPPPKGTTPSTREVKGFTAPPSAPGGQSTFTLGTWDIPYCPPRGVKVTVTADEQGNVTAVSEGKPDRFLELGRLRELSLYGSKEWELNGELSQGWEIGLEYRHDLLRTGPLWTQLGSKIGYEHTQIGNEVQNGVKVEVNARIAVRF